MWGGGQSKNYPTLTCCFTLRTINKKKKKIPLTAANKTPPHTFTVVPPAFCCIKVYPKKTLLPHPRVWGIGWMGAIFVARYDSVYFLKALRRINISPGAHSDAVMRTAVDGKKNRTHEEIWELRPNKLQGRRIRDYFQAGRPRWHWSVLHEGRWRKPTGEAYLTLEQIIWFHCLTDRNSAAAALPLQSSDISTGSRPENQFEAVGFIFVRRHSSWKWRR